MTSDSWQRRPLMRGNGVISVTGKKEIQTSLTLLRQQRQCSELTLASQSLTGSSEPPGGEGVSSNTLRDRAGEQDKGSGAAGVKRLLAFGLMSSGLVWPKVDWRPPSRENPVIPPPPTGHASIVIHPPPTPRPSAQICALSLSASIEKCKHEAANSNDPVLSQPARESVLGLRGE